MILVRDYFIPMAERAFGDATLPRADYLAMQLARELRRRSLLSFNARELRRAIGGELCSSEAMKSACEQLTEANLIRPRSKPAAGGRPPLDFEVNPVLIGQDTGASVVHAKTAESAKTLSVKEMVAGFGSFGAFGTGD